MHYYDPNGSLREYRREKDRQYSNRTILFCIGIACGVFLAVCIAYLIAGGAQ